MAWGLTLSPAATPAVVMQVFTLHFVTSLQWVRLQEVMMAAMELELGQGTFAFAHIIVIAAYRLSSPSRLTSRERLGKISFFKVKLTEH